MCFFIILLHCKNWLNKQQSITQSHSHIENTKFSPLSYIITLIVCKYLNYKFIEIHWLIFLQVQRNRKSVLKVHWSLSATHLKYSILFTSRERRQAQKKNQYGKHTNANSAIWNCFSNEWKIQIQSSPACSLRRSLIITALQGFCPHQIRDCGHSNDKRSIAVGAVGTNTAQHLHWCPGWGVRMLPQQAMLKNCTEMLMHQLVVWPRRHLNENRKIGQQTSWS